MEAPGHVPSVPSPKSGTGYSAIGIVTNYYVLDGNLLSDFSVLTMVLDREELCHFYYLIFM